MPKDDLKILISAQLNTGKSLGDINSAIKGLQKKVNALKLNVEINEKVRRTLNDFSKAMEKVQAVSQDLNKAYKEEETVLKKLDGTIEKTTRKHLKSGEIIEKTKKIVNEKTKTAVSGANEENAAIGKLSDRYKSLGEEIKRATFKDGSGKVQGFKKTFDDGTQTRTVTLDASGDNVTREQIIQNFRKIKQERERLDYALLSSQRKRQQAELDLEQKQAQAINRNIDQTHKQREAEKSKTEILKQQLSLYKQQQAINVQNAKRRYDGLIDNKALDSHLNRVNQLSHTTPKVQHQMREFAMGFRQIEANAKTAAGALDTGNRSALSFGQAMKTALIKFPIWIASASLIYAP
jgi:hypothetical protein